MRAVTGPAASAAFSAAPSAWLIDSDGIVTTRIDGPPSPGAGPGGVVGDDDADAAGRLHVARLDREGADAAIDEHDPAGERRSDGSHASVDAARRRRRRATPAR